MPTWLSDPSDGFYLILFVIVVVTVMLWARNRRRGDLIRAGIAIAALTLLFVLDTVFESPREEAVRKVGEMGRAANARDWDTVFANMSDQFAYHNIKKDAFSKTVTATATRHNATVNFKDFDREVVQYLHDGDEVRIGFIAQVTVPSIEVIPYYVEATFGRDGDGQYRMREFKVYNYAQRTNSPEERVPGL